MTSEESKVELTMVSKRMFENRSEDSFFRRSIWTHLIPEKPGGHEHGGATFLPLLLLLLMLLDCFCCCHRRAAIVVSPLLLDCFCCRRRLDMVSNILLWNKK